MFERMKNITELIMDYRYDLSVIILTKNEEELIGECIESVVSAINFAVSTGVFDTYEIILVDSASTDNTIKIAMNYPIKILQLHSSWPLSCGAGAYIGFLNTQGRKICIVDGDIVLDKSWFVCADSYIERDEVGGLQGITTEYLKGNNLLHKNAIRYGNTDVLNKCFKESDAQGELYRQILEDTIELSKGYSSSTFYLKTEAVRKAGGYNPFLVAAEDVDIANRMKEAGFTVLWIPCMMGTHYPSDKTGRITYLQKYKTLWRNSKGIGQLARYNYNKEGFTHYLSYVKNKHFFKINSILVILTMLLVLNLTFFLYNGLSIIILDFFILILLIFRINRKNQNYILYFFSLFDSLLFVLIRQFGFLVGFLKTPKDPTLYPKNPKVIKPP